MEFDISRITSSIIMVVGVGGGGGNAVSHMYRQGIADVSFMVCNTDAQALAKNPVPTKIQIGEGLGAGNDPEKGRKYAEDCIEEIKECFKVNNTHMVFVTAGMGGGTGTGAAPVIARAAKEMGILTVAIVTIPFESEGRPRIEQAIAGISLLRDCVDSLIVINNAHINEMYGNLPVSKAFSKADDILTTAAKSISDIITNPHLVNVDFADVKRVMSNGGVAIMGSAVASGGNRALEALTNAMSSPLLHHRSIEGANQVLVSISSRDGDDEVTMSEAGAITQYIQECSATGNNTNLIWGMGFDDTLGEGEIRATVVATGFDVESIPAIRDYYKQTLGYTTTTITHPYKIGKVPSNREVISLDDESEVPVAKVVKNVERESGDFEIIESSTPPQQEEPQQYNQNRYQPLPRVAAPQSAPVERVEVQVNPLSSAPIEMENVEHEPDNGEKTDMEEPLKPIVLSASIKSKKIYELSAEEIENMPAWKRREMMLDNTLPSGMRKQHETMIVEDENGPSIHQTNLFD